MLLLILSLAGAECGERFVTCFEGFSRYEYDFHLSQLMFLHDRPAMLARNAVEALCIILYVMMVSLILKPPVRTISCSTHY
jgi:hypothetical protein